MTDPFAIMSIKSPLVKKFFELSIEQKRRVCHHLPLSWKIFVEETLKKKKSKVTSVAIVEEVTEDMTTKDKFLLLQFEICLLLVSKYFF